MLLSTKAIVLNSLSYGDSSLIVHLYTEKAGFQTMLINSVRSQKAKNKQNLFQPLSLLNVIFMHHQERGIQRMKECSVAEHHLHIYESPSLRAQAFFIAELLYKSLRENSDDEALFEYLYTSVRELELQEQNSNYHLNFSLQLTRFLGFFPYGSYSASTSFFDLQEGRFCSLPPIHINFLSGHDAELFSQLLEKSGNLALNGKLRKILLEKIVLYYQLHLSGWGKMKSLEVLHSLFE